jgi:hypothetical protein
MAYLVVLLQVERIIDIVEYGIVLIAIMNC